MNLGEIKRRVYRTIGDEAGVLIQPDSVADWANDAQLEIVKRTKCLQDSYTWDVVAGTDSYDLPTDFLAVEQLSVDGMDLTLYGLSDFNKQFPDRGSWDSSGTPGHAYIWGTKLYLWPNPSGSGTDNMTMLYILRPNSINDDREIPDIPVEFHTDIVTYCISQALELNEDHAQAQAKMAAFEGSVASGGSEHQWKDQSTFPAVRLLPGDY